MTYEINLEAEVRFACKGDTQWAFLAKKMFIWVLLFG